MSALLNPGRHQVARPAVASPMSPAPPAQNSRTVPFFGGEIEATANVAVYVHPAADLRQLRDMRAVLDREIAKREAMA